METHQVVANRKSDDNENTLTDVANRTREMEKTFRELKEDTENKWCAIKNVHITQTKW